MNFVVWDTETALIRPGRAAPELACVAWVLPNEEPELTHWSNAHDLLLAFFTAAANKELLLVGHNIAFDAVVACANFPDLLPTVFAAYDAGGVRCTMLRQQLLDIAQGTMQGYFDEGGVWRKPDYSLLSLVHRHKIPISMEKDEWRLSYGQLRELPLDRWPEGAKQYPKNDVIGTLGVFLAQGTEIIPDEVDEAFAFFCLQLVSTWGLRTDFDKVCALERETKERLEEVRGKLLEYGLIRENGSRNVKAAAERIKKAWESSGQRPRYTSTGRMQLDEDACEACGDEIMSDYAAYSTLLKILSTDIELLKAGDKLPIHPGFRLLSTCRVGARKQDGLAGGNTQNLARGNKRKCPDCRGTGCQKCKGKGKIDCLGVRECFTPRPGWVFVDVDYPSLELRTLAQLCYEWLGRSTLGDLYNRDPDADPHAMMAALILGTTYEDIKARIAARDPAAIDARSLAKPANFGFAGGLGPQKFVDYAWRGYGIRLGNTEDEAIRKAAWLKEVWEATWPEMNRHDPCGYFGYIRAHEQNGTYTLVMPYTGVICSNMRYTEACNRGFQHLGATCAKFGLVEVVKACYLPGTDLFGGRVANMIHDELLVELPMKEWGPDRTSNAANIVAELFAAGAKKVLTRVPIQCTPVLSTCWSKSAEPVFDEKGRLIPWQESRA
jgi:hypothetical protein